MRPLRLGLGYMISQLKYVVKIFFMYIQIFFLYFTISFICTQMYERYIYFAEISWVMFFGWISPLNAVGICILTFFLVHSYTLKLNTMISN